ncbi:hypothetical protein ACIG5D_24435 [Microbispora rosea]|uniref:hypothetical protein n=1 Tax=Microbispora rosea TaxID=58117 RepID=UPI0037C5CC44
MGRSIDAVDQRDGATSLLPDEDAPRKVLSPKRPQTDTAGLADVFPYYAGFSYEWARAILSTDANAESAVVLDPWNGSGTTTLAAGASGLRSIGVDLNPVANIVARLRIQVGRDSCRCAPPPIAGAASMALKDPLQAWFSRNAAIRLRQWALMLDKMPKAQSTLGLVSLFRVTRQLTSKFGSRNPTWVKRASSEDDLIDIDHDQLDELIYKDQLGILERLGRESSMMAPSLIMTGSSRRLPLANKSVDLIVTSPPYLTRIDYAVAYSRELAILGIDIAEDRALRASLMGTTLIRQDCGASDEAYGPLAADLIRRVAAHDSKASRGYYLKQTRQYLDDLAASLDEITRVSKDDAVINLVVQDSYYKDVPVRLAEICREEAIRRGWEFDSWEQFEVNRLLTQVNTRARAYPKGKVAETVMTLRKMPSCGPRSL